MSYAEWLLGMNERGYSHSNMVFRRCDPFNMHQDDLPPPTFVKNYFKQEEQSQDWIKLYEECNPNAFRFKRFERLKSNKEILDETWFIKQEEHMALVNVQTELEDLVKIYQEKEEHLDKCFDNLLPIAISYMRRLVEVYDSKEEVKEKIDQLAYKIDIAKEDDE